MAAGLFFRIDPGLPSGSFRLQSALYQTPPAIKMAAPSLFKVVLSGCVAMYM